MRFSACQLLSISAFGEREALWQSATLEDVLKDIARGAVFLRMRRPIGLAPGTGWRILLMVAAVIVPLQSSKSDTLTSEEQALVDKGAFIEMYKPDEHTRHFIGRIDSTTDPKTGKTRRAAGDAQAVVCFVFGIEDAESARKEGRSMAECHYGPAEAHEFLFAQAWEKYHDRFFTRCYIQEGEEAYNQAIRAEQKHVDPSASS